MEPRCISRAQDLCTEIDPSRPLPQQLAGFLPGSPLFFTLAESRSDPATDPLAIWINGGPGSSSLVGMNTSGPCGIVRGKDGRPEMRRSETSWNAQANVLYIDNVSGSGLGASEKLGR